MKKIIKFIKVTLSCVMATLIICSPILFSVIWNHTEELLVNASPKENITVTVPTPKPIIPDPEKKDIDVSWNDTYTIESFKEVAKAFLQSDVVFCETSDNEKRACAVAENIYINDQSAHIVLVFKEFDDESMCQSYWDEGFSEEAMSMHLKNTSEENDIINGYSGNNVSYWFIDGYTYESCYAFSGDTWILEVYGFMDEPKDVTERNGKTIQEYVRVAISELGFRL